MAKEMAEATTGRAALTSAAEVDTTAEIQVPSSVAALMIPFPQHLLKRAGILAVPSENGETVSITVSSDRVAIFERSLNWCRQDRKTQQFVLENLYGALYSLVQAHQAHAETVNLLDLIDEPTGAIIHSASENFPPLVGLVEYLQDSGGQRLVPTDVEAIAGVAQIVFNQLEPSTQQKIRGEGLAPANIFANV